MPSAREHQVVQLIRLVDVFALGPVMIWAAVRSDDLPPWVRAFLGVSGAATIAFNGVRFLQGRQ